MSTLLFMPVRVMSNRLTRIASLNARSIFKDADKNIQRLFLSYLKSSSLSLDVLCLQEVSAFHGQDHLTEEQCHYFRQFLFPQYSVVFTKYCAVICLNRRLTLENAVVSLDERSIGVTVKDTITNSVLCSILNVYGPAQTAERLHFLDEFLASPLLHSFSEEFPCFFLGDFNLKIKQLTESCFDLRFKEWYQWVSDTFSNCFPEGQHTFQRGESRSTIDYIFCSASSMSRVSNCKQLYLPSTWTDHQLLQVDLLSDRKDIGPGFWRFNTTLLNNEPFLDLLDEVVNSFFISVEASSLSTQEVWESLKRALKDVSETFSRGFKSRRLAELQSLQTRYQEVSNVSGHGPSPETASIAQEISSKLDKEIQMEMKQLLVRSATRWYEKGERNTKYFYKVLRTRESQQTIQAVVSHATGDLATSTSDILKEAHFFYSTLYSPSSVDNSAIENLLRHIPPDALLSATQVQSLDQVPTNFELSSVLQHTPNHKSPGLDGLPFEVYKYLFDRFPVAKDLFLQILDDAFHGTIPPSWLQTRMVLLYKKGDPTLLSNWRPLSLINADAKLYTKLLANRFNVVLPSLINKYQTGFMPRRLISDNGWVNTTLMDNYKKSNLPLASSAVAVLLDQEKAYDRVHPTYLSRVLHHFGFPERIITSLNRLFFGTSIYVSINGFLSAPLLQGRGLRQGDPLSPLLFNLAFEPLLRSILACPTLPGVSLLPVNCHRSLVASPQVCIIPATGQDDSPLNWRHPPVFKLLSYADDLEVFLSSPAEWPVLQDILSMYSAASNAKVNIHKTEIVSLSGVAHAEWRTIASTHNISYHTADSTHVVRYLGYPLYSSRKQLKLYLGRIKNILHLKCSQLKQRGLSVRGLSLVTNSLVFSKLWHLLRVTPVPQYWLNEIRSMARTFLLDFRPAPSWNSVCQPHVNGGLGVIDVHQQQLALQLVYIQRLIREKRASDFVSPLIGHCLTLYTGHHSFLPWLQYPEEYQVFFKSLPTMNTLSLLLKKLPPLLSNHQWPTRWLADTPLKKAIFSIVPDTENHSSLGLAGLSPGHSEDFDINGISIRYLVSDVVTWSSSYNQFTNFLRWYPTPQHPDSAPRKVLHLFKSLNPPIQWMPLLQRHMPLNFNNDVPPPGYSYLQNRRSEASLDYSLKNRWTPQCRHWTFDLNNKTFPVSAAKPRLLRHYWLQQARLSAPDTSFHPRLNRIVAPCVLPSGYCSPRVWRTFWTLALPHKVVTCWWRLLKDRIGTQSYFHNLNPQYWPSSSCKLCNAQIEDTHHFFVSCPKKWSLWQAASTHLGLAAVFTRQEELWCILISLHNLNGAPVASEILIQIGCVLNVLWLSHWHCVTRNHVWSQSAALSMLSTSTPLSIILQPVPELG